VLWDVNVNGVRADTYWRRRDAERAVENLLARNANIYPHRASGSKIAYC
jgi:hypothetical protein